MDRGLDNSISTVFNQQFWVAGTPCVHIPTSVTIQTVAVPNRRWAEGLFICAVRTQGHKTTMLSVSSADLYGLFIHHLGSAKWWMSRFTREQVTYSTERLTPPTPPSCSDTKLNYKESQRLFFLFTFVFLGCFFFPPLNVVIDGNVYFKGKVNTFLDYSGLCSHNLTCSITADKEKQTPGGGERLATFNETLALQIENCSNWSQIVGLVSVS